MSDTKTALITGATSGIGYELADLLAERKYDLVLASRNIEKMKEIGAQFTAKYGVKCTSFTSDLSQPGSAKALFDACEQAGLKVDILINNSGFGAIGEHVEFPLSRVTQMAQLNMVSLVELCQLFGKPFKTRGSGYIMNVASTAAYQPIPYFAEYAATKAFVLNFSQALAMELKDYGVVVNALCPGPTQSNFFAEASGGDPKRRSLFDIKAQQTSREVAVTGLAAMFAGKHTVITGTTNKLLAMLSSSFPRSVVLKLLKRQIKSKL